MRMPCVPIFIWFIKVFCVYSRKQGNVWDRGEGRRKERMVCVRDWEIGRKVFFTSENVLSVWQQINNLRVTEHIAIKTTEYGCKQSHISEMNLVQYLRWHFLYLFLFPSLFFCCFRGQGVMYWCAFRRNTLMSPPTPASGVTNRSLFSFHSSSFLFFLHQYPVTHNGSPNNV